MRQITEECSRKGVGDFSLTTQISGYWNKADGSDIEIDMIALDETNHRIRFGSCKRSVAAHHSSSLAIFEKHIKRFLETKMGAPYRDWTIEKALYAPAFSPSDRKNFAYGGVICLDMVDFEKWLTF